MDCAVVGAWFVSWLDQAWRYFRSAPRPVSLRDVADHTGMSHDEAARCVVQLKQAGCIAFSYGSARTGRYYVPVPGKVPPQDMRGKTDAARRALERATARRWASRPISQITAARPKA